MTDHEMNIDENQKPNHTDDLPAFVVRRVGPFMQPSLGPGTIGVVPN